MSEHQSSPETIRIWSVEPAGGGGADYLLFDSADDAGKEAACLAELAWDDADTPPDEPGPPVTIRCYETSRDAYGALLREGD